MTTLRNAGARLGAGKGGAAYPPSVDRLVEQFSRLPGIGKRSAERLAMHVLRSTAEEAEGLALAVREVKRSVRPCAVCFNFADSERCRVCADGSRDAGLVLVVEQPRDVIAMESTGMYRGVYHVLLGRIAPLDGIGPESLTIDELLARVRAGSPKVREVILGLNPTLEGDGTGLYLMERLRGCGTTVTRLARGLPAGGQLELASKAVLADALEGRQSVG